MCPLFDFGPIGFLGADWWGSDARATAVALRRRGCLLVERHYEDYFPNRWRSWPLKIVRRLLRPAIESEYNQAVREILSVDALEFLLVFKGMLLHRSTLQLFQQKRIPTYLLYPDVSFQDHGGNIWDCLPYYDCLFTTKSYHAQDPGVRQRVRQLQVVGHGFDDEVHRVVSVTQKLQATYGCDVSFVGAWSPKKEHLLEALVSGLPDIDLKIWGPSWYRAAGHVRRFWQGRGAWGDETAAIYACSRINLGFLSEAGTGTLSGDQTTARTWQIPACGGFMLHEETSELRAAFEPDREVGVFSDASDLVTKVRYWLSNAQLRQVASEAARRRAHAVPYTYASAVERILQFHRQRTPVP
jgi:hypothetical protein